MAYAGHLEPASARAPDLDQAFAAPLSGPCSGRYHLHAGVDHIFLKSEDSPEFEALLQQLGAQRAQVAAPFGPFRRRGDLVGCGAYGGPAGGRL